MRKWVIVLALTSVAFAGSTAYYAHQLSVERAKLASHAARPAPITSAIPAPSRDMTATRPAEPAKTEARLAATGTAVTSQVVSGVMINGQPMSEADMKKMQADFSRRFLAQLADPERREEMLAERKMLMRNSYPRVDQVLGLSPEEYARFIELSALQQLDLQEASSRCALDTNCRMEDFYGQAGTNRNQEIDNLLGAERRQKLETYMNTMGERESVTQLRNRLPDAQRFGSDQAEALVNALADERNAIHREARQQGVDSSGFGMGAGMVFTTSDGDSFEERYASAKLNSQRLRDRAAQYLNAEQMRVFNEMQEETLLSLRGALRNKDGDAEIINFSAALPLGH